MDAFKLLTRSTKLKPITQGGTDKQQIPSEGPKVVLKRVADLQSFDSPQREADLHRGTKRKRGGVDGGDDEVVPNGPGETLTERKTNHLRSAASEEREPNDIRGGGLTEPLDPEEELSRRRAILKRHRIKIVDLTESEKSRKSSLRTSGGAPLKAQKEAARLFPRPLISFKELDTNYKLNPALYHNILDQGYQEPIEVQLALLPSLLSGYEELNLGASTGHGARNLLTIAPTGSGKTLAFLIPLIDKLAKVHQKTKASVREREVSAIIVAPTKELVGQIVIEGRKLCERTGVRITSMRKGMRLQSGKDSSDFDGSGNDLRDEQEDETFSSLVKSDIIVTTPLLLVNSITDPSSLERRPLPSVTSLILDEADILLDPLFRDQTLSLFHSCNSPELHTSFWSATIGSNVEQLILSLLSDRYSNLGVSNPPHLLRCVVGLKDSALPNISHRLIYSATEPGKLLGLRQLLHPPPSVSSGKTTQPLRPPFLVFTQTIERAAALHAELLYDIPAEAGGSARIAVLHSDLSDTKRAEIMTKFRKGEIWVMITTDLLSRGVDFRGLNGVVNYDIPTTSAAYVHRVGRTGRAGREGGIAVTFYTNDDIKYVKGIANVISASQKGQKVAPDGGREGVQKWLLNALPDVSKKERQRLKTRGVEVRRAIREGEDSEMSKAKRRVRISTKSGYERREENRRRGAAVGSRRRMELDDDGSQEESITADGDDFGGFDD